MKTADLKAEDGTLDWAAAQCEQNPFFRGWSFHKYESEFRVNSPNSVVTKKKGKHSTVTIVLSSACMKPSINKYYRVQELTFY